MVGKTGTLYLLRRSHTGARSRILGGVVSGTS